MILATQKPAGTVDENIWSNSKFKLCLRVQDKQDSKEMLHKEDASVHNADPGVVIFRSEMMNSMNFSSQAGAELSISKTVGSDKIQKLLF